MKTPEKNKKLVLIRIAIIVFVIIITIVILLSKNQIIAFTERIPGMGFYAYPAIFLISIVANATIIIPVPGVALTALLGAFFNPLGVAIAAGLGASIGEISGYLTGFSGQGVIEKTKWNERLEGWMKKYGDITILVLSFIPNPLFDMAGMTAGALKMPIFRFLFWCGIGKILKMLMFSFLGDTLVGLIPS